MKFSSDLSRGFTLVELIVVITVLAILSTIAYISLLGYNVIARDTVRKADITTIAKSIELYGLENTYFPEVTNPIEVSFSGGVLWKQGSFGNDSYVNVKRISEIPTDPLTGSEYAYSTTMNSREYQIGAIVERAGSFVLENKFLQENTYAADILPDFATTFIRGNYNGKYLTYTEEIGSVKNIYILGVPSILTREISDIDLEQVHQNNSFVLEGIRVAPGTYSGSVLQNTGVNLGLTDTDTDGNGSNNEYAVIQQTNSTVLSTDQGKIDLINNIQTYYNNSEVPSSQYKDVNSLDPVNNRSASLVYVNTLLNSEVGGLSGERLGVQTSNTGNSSQDTPLIAGTCYDPTSLFTIGVSGTVCENMLIVDTATLLGAKGTWSIDHSGQTYTFGDSDRNIFTGQVTAINSLFSYTNFNEDIGYWDTSNVDNMSRLFRENSSFNQDISSWDTSKVVNMRQMFRGATAITSLDLNDWDTGLVEDMNGIFNGMTSLTSLSIEDWDTSSAIDMGVMFHSSNVVSLDLSKWDVSKAENMNYMFYAARSLSNLNLSNWNTVELENMDEMFSRTDSLVSAAGLENFNVSGVTGMDSTFDLAISFNQDLSNWCVDLIGSEPHRFSLGATNWILPKPNWGGCSPI